MNPISSRCKIYGSELMHKYFFAQKNVPEADHSSIFEDKIESTLAPGRAFSEKPQQASSDATRHSNLLLKWS